jgi:glutamate N-acetyltransferase/amino-acid N-acetyltransferase
VAVSAVHNATWPSGITGAGVACGIKEDGRLDLGLLVSERPATWAGTFTRNAAAAPSVRWSRARLGGRVRAVVANSGNANACTGAAGEKAVASTAAVVGRDLGCAPDEVLVASTGPIGVPLPVSRLTGAVPNALGSLGPDPEPFARAILTTDTGTKLAQERAGDARVVGVAKGAAMLAPNMATMLAFVATDAAVGHAALQASLRGAVDRSFNRICIDACESTNDSVFCLATGATSTDESVLSEALRRVCASLAQQIARDAEGATRLMRVRVLGAADERSGAELARAVAASALWRAAAHGADPNWGRIAAALGAAERSLELSRLSIAIGEEVLFAKGEPVGSPEQARRHQEGSEVTVTCTVGEGPARVEVLSSDLSPDYVRLNAGGTT